MATTTSWASWAGFTLAYLDQRRPKRKRARISGVVRRAAGGLPRGLGPALLAAADQAQVGVVATPRGSVQSHALVSPGAARLLGYEPAELERLSPGHYLSPELLAALGGDYSLVRDDLLRKKDGGELRASVAKEADPGSHFDVYVFREERAGALERARADFQRLLDAAPDGVAVIGQSGLLYANPVLLRWIGSPDVAALAKLRVTEVIHTHDVEKATQAISALLAEPGSRGVLRIRVRRAGGGLFDVECLGLGAEWDGQPACVVVARDLSQRRHDQSRLIVADRSASVGTMSAGVAHEINNPLAYLLLNLEYLLRELPEACADPARMAHLAERLAESRHGAERVGQILKELGSLSSRRRTRRHGVDLGEVLRRALRTVEREVSDRAELRVEDEGVPSVDADPNSLEQLFINILANAAQAFPTPRADHSVIVVRLSTGEDGSALVEVKDSGKGIAPEHLNRIFDPFFTTKPSGTGLGLPISHAIVRSFGGQISVDSELGKGTTFRVVLPPGTRPAAELARSSSVPVPAGRRARVLVVDDDAVVAETLRRVLAERYEVQVSTSAEQALAVLGADPGFDVVLCDLLMPDMSGMDLHEALAQTRPGLEERLVFMTGGAFTARARDFLRRVGNPRLEKPFEFEQLHAIVGERLAQNC